MQSASCSRCQAFRAAVGWPAANTAQHAPDSGPRGSRIRLLHVTKRYRSRRNVRTASMRATLARPAAGEACARTSRRAGPRCQPRDKPVHYVQIIGKAIIYTCSAADSIMDLHIFSSCHALKRRNSFHVTEIVGYCVDSMVYVTIDK